MKESEVPTMTIGCKFNMPDCLFRGTNKCTQCIDRSKYEWDYTDRY
jgi:hypothetical protein